MKDGGFYVRTLLPVRRLHGHVRCLAVGRVGDAAPRRTVWHAPEYVGLRIEGDIANAVPPWDAQVLGARVLAEVRNENEIPYVAVSDDPLIARILTDEWPHDDVLPHLPT